MFDSIKNFLAKGSRDPAPAPAGLMYNLLFCDDPSLYRTAASQPVPWHILLDDRSDPGAVQALAADETQESRVRCLAFNWLRRNRQPVPKGVLLGTIVEVGLPQGLDVIAAFLDGRVRYINHTGKIAVFETAPPDVAAAAQNLIAVSQPVIRQIGPWDKARRPPPPTGSVRMTFLVSDGLYFGEGPVPTIQRDPLGGQVYAAAGRLLQCVTAAAINQTGQ